MIKRNAQPRWIWTDMALGRTRGHQRSRDSASIPDNISILPSDPHGGVGRGIDSTYSRFTEPNEARVVSDWPPSSL